jgi:type IV secretion system protein VirB4
MNAALWQAQMRRELPASVRIPYATLVSPYVLRTYAGDYVQTFRLAGASFETADDATLNQWHERLNLCWRNLASTQVALWTHMVRRRESALVLATPATGFAASLAGRYAARMAGETLMVNELYLSLVYRPAPDRASGLVAKVMRSRPSGMDVASHAEALDSSEKLAQALAASLERYEPERLGVYRRGARWCSRLLEFLSLLVNGEWQPVPLPRGPVNEALCTSRPVFGTEVMAYRQPACTRTAAMLAIKEYPTPSVIGMYNALLSAPFSHVLTQSFTCLGKAAAQGLLQRQIHRMANAGDFAVSQTQALSEALDELTSNEFVMGDHHFSLQVLTDDTDSKADSQGTALNDAVSQARALLADCGMTVAREDLGLEAAFWAQLPGCFAMRARKAPITSRNFAAMAPFHNFPIGRARDNHWGDALAVFMTPARSPYYFSLHASDPASADGGSRKDTGHTFICGPTGSGKTVLLGFLMTLLAGRGTTQVVFDKDQGLEILIRALGGQYYALPGGEPTGFNPLQLEPTPANVEFLKAWLRMLVRGTRALGAREQADLEQALRGVLALPAPSRRLSRLIEFTDATDAEGVHARLSRWCACTGGDAAWVFDNPTDTLGTRLREAPLIGFDVTEFLSNELIRAPLNRYLFHLVEQLLDGRPLVCWIDEFSHALADPDFQSFADNAPKTWRKLNGVLCAATQTASGVLASPIARTLVEQTATKIFYPNPDAARTDYVDGFGLSEREFDLIHEQLEPGSRCFLVKQGHVSVVCELDLKGFDAELRVISGRKRSVQELHALMGRVGTAPSAWLDEFMRGVAA